MRLYRILLDPQSEPGNPPAEATADKGKAHDPVEVTEKIIAKYGSATEAVRMLANQTYDLREANRELRAKVPSDGSVVLTGDDAATWTAYRSLGKPEDIRKVVKEHGELSGFKSQVERRDSLSAIGKTAGVAPDKIGAFIKIAGDAQFEVKSEKKDDKSVDSVLVKDGDKEPIAFDIYFADFLPALKPAEAEKPKPNGTPNRSIPTTPIVPDGTAVRRREAPLVR